MRLQTHAAESRLERGLSEFRAHWQAVSGNLIRISRSGQNALWVAVLIQEPGWPHAEVILTTLGTGTQSLPVSGWALAAGELERPAASALPHRITLPNREVIASQFLKQAMLVRVTRERHFQTQLAPIVSRYGEDFRSPFAPWPPQP